MPTERKRGLFDEVFPLLIDPVPDSDGGFMAFCPAHSDGAKHGMKGGRSLHLHPDIGLTCFARCEFTAVMDALYANAGRTNGHRPLSSTPPPSRTNTDERLVAIYHYKGADGTLLAIKGRFETPEGKSFRWRLPGASGWNGLAPLTMEDLPLFGAELVAAAPADQEVYFCEGEKTALACREHGLLAVTFGGGASSKKFGAALDILTGRNVALWPDNDAAGRKYMAVVEGQLRTIARSVRYIVPPVRLPEKGDAYDYFQLGGTVADLESKVLRASVTEFIDEDSVLVRVPTPRGVVRMAFMDIDTAKREFNCELTVSIEGETDGTFPYTQRINTMSSSQRTELRRCLDENYGKDVGWTRVVMEAFAFAHKAHLGRERAIDARSIEDDDGASLLIVDPLLPENAATVLFADGSSGKTYLAIFLAICFAIGDPFIGMQTPGLPVLFVDWEGNERTFRRRMNRLCAGISLDAIPPKSVYYWPARGAPLSEIGDALLKFVRAKHIGLVIFDSAGPACGGEPEKAEVAISFFRHIARLGVTCLLLAHITKAGETEKSFGCYSEDTEVLTRTGWRLHKDVTTNDEVGCFNADTEALEWHRPNMTHAYPYVGPMVNINGGTKSPLDILVTPNHRMVVQPNYPLPVGSNRKLKNPRGWSFRTAGTLGGTVWKLPYALIADLTGVRQDANFARFLGWWLSEGCLGSWGPVLTQADGPLAQRMRETVKALGYDSNIWVGHAKDRPDEQPCMQLRLKGATQFGHWLADKCGVKAAHKHIPDEAFTWDGTARQELLKALMEGDGCERTSDRWSYSSISRQLADDVQRLAIGLGYSARISQRPAATPRCHTQYIVQVGTREAITIRSRNISTIPYDGMVYCLTVPTGAYITRRNGRMAIAGNSVYWHNEPRRTWYLERVQEENSQTIDIGLFCKKVNDGPLPSPFILQLQFEDPNGPVRVLPGAWQDTPKLSAKRSLKSQVWDALSKPKTALRIAEELGIDNEEKTRVVAQCLNRGKDSFVRVGEEPGSTGRPAILWGRAARLARAPSDTP